MGFWSKLFKKSDKLQNEVVTTQTITVPVKKDFYHEICQKQGGGFIVRIYSRKDGCVAEVVRATLDEAKEEAFKLLSQYNKGK